MQKKGPRKVPKLPPCEILIKFVNHCEFFIVGHNIPFRNLLPGSLAPSTNVLYVEGTDAVTWGFDFHFHASFQFQRFSGGQSHGLNLADTGHTGKLLRALNVVSYFSEVFPVDAWDFAFELVVFFFGALFVRRLTVGSSVVGEVADA
jgi:hypothetical protein